MYLPLSTVPLPPVDTLNNSEYTTTGYWGWFNAPIPPPGSFLVNVGLAMELWSGGAYRATLHRVVFPEGQDDLKDRFSLAYFVQPDDQVVGGVCDEAHVRKFNPWMGLRPLLPLVHCSGPSC